MDNEEMKSEVVYGQFKEMERRYHTWMNYYSLFNGALLVAYCTILVSTGQIIEMGGGFSNEELTGNAKSFQLECTYWNILALIAFLGCIASYCWYLSAIGHYYWIGRWRKVLMEQMNYPKLDFNDVKISPCCDRAAHFHSTFRVTIGFIVFVLSAWIVVAYCSIFDHEFTMKSDKLLILLFVIFLIALEFIIHLLTGSDLSEYSQIQNKKGLWCIIYEGIFKNLNATIFILLYVVGIIYAVVNCQTSKPVKVSCPKDKSEMLFKFEIFNSDSLIFNGNVTMTVKQE